MRCWLQVLVIGILASSSLAAGLSPIMKQDLQIEENDTLDVVLSELQVATNEKEFNRIQEVVDSKYVSLSNDPFIPPSQVETRVLDWIDGKSPQAIIESAPRQMGKGKEYWELMEKVYNEHRDRLSKKQDQSIVTGKLFEKVYAYNDSLKFIGAPVLEDTILKFQLHNGTQEPIEQIRIKIRFYLPENSIIGYLEQEPTVRLKKGVNPWDTYTVNYSIQKFLPESFKLGPISDRSELRIEMELINFKHPKKKWAIVYFSETDRRSLNYFDWAVTNVQKRIVALNQK